MSFPDSTVRSPPCPPSPHVTCMHLIPHVVVVTTLQNCRLSGKLKWDTAAANKEFNYEKRRNLRPKHGKKSRSEGRQVINLG